MGWRTGARVEGLENKGNLLKVTQRTKRGAGEGRCRNQGPARVRSVQTAWRQEGGQRAEQGHRDHERTSGEPGTPPQSAWRCGRPPCQPSYSHVGNCRPQRGCDAAGTAVRGRTTIPTLTSQLRRQPKRSPGICPRNRWKTWGRAFQWPEGSAGCPRCGRFPPAIRETGQPLRATWVQPQLKPRAYAAEGHAPGALHTQHHTPLPCCRKLGPCPLCLSNKEDMVFVKKGRAGLLLC